MQVLDDFMNAALMLSSFARRHNLPLPGLALSEEWNDFILQHTKDTYVVTDHAPSVYGLPIKWVSNATFRRADKGT